MDKWINFCDRSMDQMPWEHRGVHFYIGKDPFKTRKETAKHRSQRLDIYPAVTEKHHSLKCPPWQQTSICLVAYLIRRRSTVLIFRVSPFFDMQPVSSSSSSLPWICVHLPRQRIKIPGLWHMHKLFGLRMNPSVLVVHSIRWSLCRCGLVWLLAVVFLLGLKLSPSSI